MFSFKLLEGEKVVKILRQSEAVLFKPVISVFILIYFPWYFLLKYELLSAYTKPLFVWTVLVFLYAVNKYILWLLNAYLITDRRVVSVSYQNLLHKHVMESPLKRVLNVSFSMHGLWQSLFRFGSVKVSAHGMEESLVLKNISKPWEVKDFLWKMLNEHINP